MNISEFLAEEMTLGAKFLVWWTRQNRQDPETFPMDMEPGEWDPQYRAFAEAGLGVEEAIDPDTTQEEGRLDTYHALAGGDHSSLQGTKTGRTQWREPNTAAPPRADLPSHHRADKVKVMDREEVINAQGWDVISLLHHAETFIELKGLDEDFDEYLRGMARNENEGEPQE
jgi:hypothetical protein